ncbi:MAG: glycine cleavage system protein GcvH [Betaproteobacteria bacterium]|jgi:glycine cleavage system H protein|nr:glycine cleavage system protein GcvH [Betaproteobacteria bacterium]
MNFPADLRYTASHEWVRLESDGTLTIGITDLAQDSLGELVYVDLPALGKNVAAGDSCAVVESTKAASDVYAPVAGEVIATNEALSGAPQTVNESPYETGWLFRLKPAAAGAEQALLTMEQYTAGPGAH